MLNDNFIKKEHIALIYLAQYFLNVQLNQKIETVSQLSERFSLSVGVIQKALKFLEKENHIQLCKKGCQGSFLVKMNPKSLVALLSITKLVCVMPLPYTKLYEGLASGLKQQFDDIPLYFAHMRGAESRLECLYSGIYDIAVTSYLACESWLTDKLEIVVRLGKGSYVQEHALICHQDTTHSIKRIGVDMRSPDQRKLTEFYFSEQDIEIVPITYNSSITLLNSRQIDAVIWNTADRELVKKHQFSIKPLHNNALYNKATEAVILIKKDNEQIKKLLQLYINPKKLLQHQNDVNNGSIEPCY